MGRIRVAALAPDGVVSFDLACAVQAFNRSPEPSGRREHCQLRTCGMSPGPVKTRMLDGRPATTHWAYCDSLARAHPQVEVRPRDLFVDDGDILTSAGLAAGLDMCLHLVRREVGTAAASRLARWNVVAPFRDGGQAQFIPAAAPLAVEGEIGETVAWARRQLVDRPTVARLARHACMSERTFNRRFIAEMGVAPKRWLLDQQTQVARELLEHTDLPVEAIAAQAGFPSAAALRAQFRRQTSTTTGGSCCGG